VAARRLRSQRAEGGPPACRTCLNLSEPVRAVPVLTTVPVRVPARWCLWRVKIAHGIPLYEDASGESPLRTPPDATANPELLAVCEAMMVMR